MNVSENQLEDLLALVAVDQLMQRSRAQLETLRAAPEVVALEAELLEASAAYLAANNAFENLEMEIKRVDADLEVVLARIKRDEAALNATSNSKEAGGLEHELNTLARRKSELEDAELELMEQAGTAKDAVDAAVASKRQVEERLAAAREELKQQLGKLASGIELQGNDRAALAARIPHDLLELYAAKSRKGVPVARLLNRECGACNMSLTAAALSDLASKPSDELVTCPECGAVLVR